MPSGDLGEVNPLPPIAGSGDLHKDAGADDVDDELRFGLGYGKVETVLPYLMQDGYSRGLREAAHPIFEADRHAKKELKKQVRGIRRIERTVEERDDPEAAIVQGYCAAVRSAITDDGRAPLAAAGLTLKQRLETVAGSLDRVQQKGASRRRSRACTR